MPLQSGLKIHSIRNYCLAALLGVDKSEIVEIMQRCNYSDSFIKTANDFQVMDAISQCYEEYNTLKRK